MLAGGIETSKYSMRRGCLRIGAGSLARLGHLLDVQKVAGSSPVRPTKIVACDNVQTIRLEMFGIH